MRHSIKLKETEKVARQLFNQATFGLSREGKEPRDRRQQVSANKNLLKDTALNRKIMNLLLSVILLIKR